MMRTSLTTALLADGSQLILPCQVNFYYITTNQQVREAVNELLPIVSQAENKIAIDVETTGFDPYLERILLLQIGTEQNVQYVFDCRTIDKTLLKPLLESKCWKVGHNIKFDAKFIKINLGISLTHMYDTMLAEQIIRGGEYFGGEGYSLDAVIKRRLGKELQINKSSISEGEANTDKVKKQLQKSFLNYPSKKEFSQAQLAYAAQDVSSEMILDLANWQINRLQQKGPSNLYDPKVTSIANPEIRDNYEKMLAPALSSWNTALLEFKFLEVVIDLELNGIGFNVKRHQEVLQNIEKDYLEHKKDFLKLLSKVIPQKTLFGTASVNPDSTKQVLDALQAIGVKAEDTGANTLDALLRSLKKDSVKYSIVEALLNYRKASKLLQAFGQKLSARLHPVTKRIHCDVKQILDTGRMSTSNVNLQQIPRSIDWKLTGNAEADAEIRGRPGLRECFEARPGYKFVIYDYSAQELRVVASISLEKTMLRAFVDGKDLHSYSATLMYGGNYEDFNKRRKEEGSLEKEQRQIAKVVSFGSLYGSGPQNLAKVLHIDLEQAGDILKRFWESYPNLRDAMQRYGQLAIKYGYSNTVLGRRRYYTNILEEIKWVSVEKSPKNVENKLRDLGMTWVLEEGPITEENSKDCIKKIIKKLEGNIARQAANHAVQGTSADCTKLASIKVRNDLISKKIDAQIVALVHDELVVEVKEEEVPKVQAIMEKRMNWALNFFCPNVPSEVEGHVDACWRK